MSRTLRNTLSVLAVTALTALMIFAAVQVTGWVRTGALLSGTSLSSTLTSNSNGSSELLVCPRTGCSAASCHAQRWGARQ